MFKHLYLSLVIWVFVTSSVHAKSYIRDYNYNASDADSKITSRTNALDQVKLILLQEIGTHIRQEINITKDGLGNSYASEDVEAITAGLTKVEIIDEKWNGETYYLKASIEADTTRVLNALEAFKSEKTEESEEQLQALKDNQRKLKESRELIAALRNQLSQANNSNNKNIALKYIEGVEQISLSDMVSKGYNFTQQGQYDDASYWYRKAADKGNVVAQHNLGVIYLNGYGVEKNYETAVQLFRKASDNEYSSAQGKLGSCYFTGKGVKQDYSKAEFWLSKAAEQGNATAYVYLGVLYRNIKKDYEQAAHWFTKGSEQDQKWGHYFLAKLFDKGMGVKQDKEFAITLYKKACKAGIEQSCSKADNVR